VMTIVATLGVGALLSTIATAIYPGVQNASFLPSPTWMPTLQLGALQINQAYMAMLVFGPVAVLALTVFLRHSRYGVGIRCSSANPEAARMAGISTNNMSSLAWILAGVLSALTAVLVIPASGFASSTSFGPSLLLRALAAALLARMYSLPIAFGAGVLIGVVEEMLLYSYPNSPGLVDVMLYVIIVVALLLQRGQRGREEEKGSWAAVIAWQPLSKSIARLPEVRLARWGAGAAALSIAVAIPGMVSNSTAVIFSTIFAFSIVGLSVGIVLGLSGQLSLGQFAIAAVGAVVAFDVSENAPFALALTCAGLAGAAVSLVIGLPTLRTKGPVLAVTTLGFALLAGYWGLSEPWALGEGVLPSPPTLLGHQFDSGKSYYYIVLAVLLLALLIAWNARRLGLGRALMAIRDNEDNARAFTLPARRLKLEGFILAGFIAGLGGAVYGFLLSSVDATAFPVQSSIDVVAMTVIGGMSILVGPILGAFYIVGLPQLLPQGTAGIAATQLGWLVLILYLPGGFAQGIEPLRARYVRWAARRHGLDLDADERLASSPTQPSSLSTLAGQRRLLRSTGDVLLEGSGLRKAFGGVVAVSDLSISVRKGEIVGLMGPNGAGKTTTFEILSGFTRPDRGSVNFDGTDVSAMSPEQRGRLGLIRSFQDAALFSTLTVSETLQLSFERQLPTSFFRSILGRSAKETEKRHRANELVELMGLGPYRSKRIHELSTGTRRITELACMVALSPTLLLLDEPSSGIAQRETEALAVLLRRLKDELDLTMLIIEHDIPLIMGLADRIIVMDLGSIIADGTPATIPSDPLVIAAYLGTNSTAIHRSEATPVTVATSSAYSRSSHSYPTQ